MAELITCTPRILPPGEVVAAADAAVRINPMNQPNLEAFAAMPGFALPDLARAAILVSKYWGLGGVKLTVAFLDNPSNELRSKILSHLNAWNKTANIEFVETAQVEDAQVRINRERTNDPMWAGFWSFLGTDILKFAGPNNQTMNLEAFTMHTPDSEFFRVVRHEAGHTLGFIHEHMRQELVNKIDREKAISHFGRLTGWTPEQVVQQVLTPLESSSLRGTAFADPNSIMAYHVPGSITIDGQPIIGGLDIDESDYNFAALIYPK